MQNLVQEHFFLGKMPAVRLEVLNALHMLLRGAPSLYHDSLVAKCVLPFLSSIHHEADQAMPLPTPPLTLTITLTLTLTMTLTLNVTLDPNPNPNPNSLLLSNTKTSSNPNSNPYVGFPEDTNSKVFPNSIPNPNPDCKPDRNITLN